jgi:hypothetical protein
MFLRADLSLWLSWLPYLSLGILPLVMIYSFSSRTDIILLFSLVLFRNWKAAYRILQFYDLHLDFRILRAVLIIPVAAQIAKLLMERPKTDIKPTVEGPKPLFFPSRTTHTGLFPKTHSFSYSYLLVGIPVGWQGSVGDMLSADQGTHSARSTSSRSWYNVDAGDYLDRGHHQLRLESKLRKFILSQVCFWPFI